MFGITVVTPPTTEPLSLDEAKQWLKVTWDEQDQLISSLIPAAREYVETWTGLALLTQTLRLTRDRFPTWKQGSQFVLPRPPVQSVTNIQYTDNNGATQTVDASTYVVDLTSQPGRIALAYGETWPTDVIEQIGSVKVNYVAGYTSAALVPARVKQAMIMLIANWFVNPEPISRDVSAKVAFAVDALLGMSQTCSLAGDFG